MKKKKKSRQEDAKKPIRMPGRRVGLIYTFVFISMGALLLRLAYVQVSKGSNYRIAQKNELSYTTILPPRGWIWDANHQLIAYDTPSMSVTLTRLHNPKIQDFNDLSRVLAPVFHMSVPQLLDKMENYNQWQDQVYLYQDATPAQVAFISENKAELPGIELVVTSQRTYPFGSLAGQVLGYVGPIQAADAKKYTSKPYNYELDQIVGRSGLEQQYEQYLQGQVGLNAVMINNEGIPIETLGMDPPPTSGDSLQLTLDGHLQSIAQSALADKLKQLNQQGTPVNTGAVVMMNPNTGGILAMASYPYLNPNWYLNPKLYQQHASEFMKFPSPDYNMATLGEFTPGSTVKPANMMLGLLKGTISTTTTVDDTGALQVGNYLMHGDEANGAGVVNPVTTLEVSDDIFMYQLSLWMAHYPPANMNVNTWVSTVRTSTLHEIYSFEKKFGLGVLNGIDLPAESTGKFGDQKTLYDLPAAAIGQNQAFTPLQLADYVSAIANSGKVMEPHFMQSITAPDGKVVARFKPKVISTIKAPQKYWDVLHQGMYLVANSPLGTASGSFMDAPYKAAGKTGTAQLGNKQDTSLFIAYAPANKPEVAIAVVIPGGGYGALGAVPVARQLLDAYFQEHHASFFPKTKWSNTTIAQPPQ